ncbi:maleylpyruvate isomerase family mycothiol-dependent enzyme [Aeromicrobium sp.]|uniref:maleylpyruvate isomerase family mycothiol-dependent enzyme n=1 Tax=Aeromicrobium sp. TaxID=1871063 RepID=UPI003C46C296
MSLLETYVRGWHESVDSILALAAELDDADWAQPTDCPTWTVKDVLAHVAHLETELSRSEAGSHEPTGAREIVSSYTAIGVEERADHTPAQLVAELAAAVELRLDQLADLPSDPSALAPGTPGGVAWSWDTLLRNRTIDMWVHEQDIRRATGRPGGLDSTGAQVVVMAFSFAMPMILGKRVKPPAGSTVQWQVTGETPLELVVRIGEDGRASQVEHLEQPSTTLSMSTETFTVLTAGRRTPDQVEVEVTGDQELGRSVLAAMAVTP